MDDLCDYTYDTCRQSINLDTINDWLVENKGALGATQEQLLSMGPESGIFDGESPSISLPYIDKERTNIRIHVQA